MGEIKITLEYEMKSAPVMLLWNYISTTSGLEQWFADKVEHEGKKFVFYWNGAGQEATQIAIRTGMNIRFRWAESGSKTYFEMKISVSELTDETVLVVTDYAQPDEVEETKELWNNQVESLRRILGC